jgi:tripartite-type tricarboxylate transporter receptor subunit TctC
MKGKTKYVKKYLILVLIGFTCIGMFFDEAMPAEKFPEKPIKLLVGWSPGGIADLTGRMLAGLTTEYIGQPVVVINRPGASQTIATNELAASKPDGYTLEVIVMGPFILGPFSMEVKYHPLKSFEPLFEYGVASYGICVLKDAPWNSYKELIDFAKKNPGELSMSTAGVGTNQHLAFESIAKQEGIQWKHVPYPGGAPAAAALLGGHVKAHFGSGSHVTFVESGKFKLLASYSANRYTIYPDVPTLKELGYDIPVGNAYFVAAPKGVPEPILNTLEDALTRAAQSVTFKGFLKKVWMEPDFKNREQLRKLIEAEYAGWNDIVKKLDLKTK